MSGKLFFVGVIVAVTLTWLACSGSQERGDTGRIPDVVFGGGGGVLEIRLEVNQPSHLVASFEQYDDESDDGQIIEAGEDIAPGAHTRTVSVSPDTYVYFELGVPDATVGAEVKWVVKLNGQEILSENDHLTEPLRSGYAFFLQFEADSLDEMRAWMY